MGDDLEQLINDLGQLSTLENVIHVYARGTAGYNDAIVHRFPNGISEVTRFVVEPGNEMALRGLIELLVQKLEKGIKIPFGIKSGGHFSVPKIYPPNKGILISMKRFNYINYNKGENVLDVGAGVIWKDVYDYLSLFGSEPDLGVVGGDPLVGVSGWLLGGGYSLLTNRFGLGIDNVIAFQVILPSKGICNIHHDSEEDREIFRALKGGGHNFGIITKFTLRVHKHAKRTPVRSKEFPESESSFVKDTLIKFIEDEARPQAAVLLAAFRHDVKDGKLKSSIPLYSWCTDRFLPRFPQTSENPGLAQSLPEPCKTFSLAPYPFCSVTENRDLAQSLPEAYEAFSLRHLPVSLETLKTDFHSLALDSLPGLGAIVPDANKIEKCLQSFGLTDECLLSIYRKSFMSLRNGNFQPVDLSSLTGLKANSLTVFTAARETVVMESPPDLRGRMAGIVVKNYNRILIDAAEEQARVLSSGMLENQGIRVSFEIWPFHKDAFKGVKREDSAWPHEEGKVFGPLVGFFEWSGKDKDEYWLGKITESLEKLRQVALEQECTTEDLPVYLNIALENTPVKAIYRDRYEQLERLRHECDPNNVMGSAAGFVIGAQ